MGMMNTLIHGETAFMAEGAKKIVVNEVILSGESGFVEQNKVVFNTP